MSGFFGELIGGIVEGFLDAIGKSKPTNIPKIEYKSEYVREHKEHKGTVLLEHKGTVLLC